MFRLPTYPRWNQVYRSSWYSSDSMVLSLRKKEFSRIQRLNVSGYSLSSICSDRIPSSGLSLGFYTSFSDSGRISRRTLDARSWKPFPASMLPFADIVKNCPLSLGIFRKKSPVNLFDFPCIKDYFLSLFSRFPLPSPRRTHNLNRIEVFWGASPSDSDFRIPGRAYSLVPECVYTPEIE